MNDRLDISVLLVEDDNDIRSILATVLQEMAREVRTAPNGVSGLELYNEARPDLLITDVKMPRLGGLEMIRQIRYFDSKLKIIVMSAYEETSTFIEAIDIGVDGFLMKPIHIDRLTSLVGELGSVAQLEHKLAGEEEERRRVEDALGRSEARYRSLFGSMRDGVALFSFAGGAPCVEEANPAFHELVGESGLDVLPLPELVEQFRETELPVLVECYVPQQRKHLRINLFQPQDDLFAVILTDITDRKRIEEEIQALNRDLGERVEQELHRRQEQQRLLIQKSKLESLGILAAGIAHEVNQPLTRISLGLGNIVFKSQRGKLSAAYIEEKCEALLGDVERIKTIIDHVKTFSREQKSDLFARVDVNAVVQGAMLLVQNQYRNHGITLDTELAEDVRPTVGNMHRLEQVLLNLLSNARDAVEVQMESQGEGYAPYIVIRTRQDGPDVVIEVIDNGSGIPPEDLEMIFEPFFTRKDTDRGSGLGLSISYGIVSEMKGSIKAFSEHGDGTRMCVRLPGIGDESSK